VVFCFFVAVIVLAFVTMHPAVRIAGLLSAAIIAGWQQGLRRFVRSCWLYLTIIIVVALLNSLFNPRGLTILFFFLGNPVSFETMVYGASSGMMLATVLLWFSAYQKMMSQQGFLALFSRVAPTMALMVAKVMAFVPNIAAQAHVITAARKVLAGDATRNVSYAVRLSSQLLEWGMESSLITADSMRARGFGSTKRTSYRSMKLTRRDVMVLIVLAVLVVGASYATYVVAADFGFYPYIDEMQPWWWYVPTMVLGLFPLLLEGGELLRWRF